MLKIDEGSRFGGRRAVVIGGSMAGLLAARVLSRHFDEVALVERDPLPDSFEARKGVPQGRQVHAVLRRGEEIIEGLFPGIAAAMIAGGAVRGDFGRDVGWFHAGVWKRRCESGMLTIFLSRPYLEGHVRRRVFALPQIRRHDEHDVTGFVVSADRARVTGVKVRRRGEGAEETLDADLVVDAGGRGSSTPKWLEALGAERPQESSVGIDVKYASRPLRRTGDLPGGDKGLFLVGKAPESKRLGAIMPMEGDRWMALVAGILGDHPPTDPEGFLAYARTLPVPDLANFLEHAEPLGDIVAYRFPANLRRHYERLARPLEGLVVLGDALCSFNPFYGQGMTTAGLGALALGEMLSEQRRGEIDGLARRYFARMGKVTDVPWMMTTGEDFRYPEVRGERPLMLPVMEWYMNQVHRATATDTEVFRVLLRAMHMMGSPFELFDPRVALRVLRAARARP